jgi:hypothetical protein
MLAFYFSMLLYLHLSFSLIYFYSQGPCKMIAPFYAEQALLNPHLQFLKVDVDELSDLAGKYNIQAMPTFVALDNKNSGAELERLQGASQQHLSELIRNSSRGAAPQVKVQFAPGSNVYVEPNRPKYYGGGCCCPCVLL